MILSFRDVEAEKVFNNEASRKLPSDIQTVALRKLLQLHAAVSLQSLQTQAQAGARDVEIVDHH